MSDQPLSSDIINMMLGRGGFAPCVKKVKVENIKRKEIVFFMLYESAQIEASSEWYNLSICS